MSDAIELLTAAIHGARNKRHKMIFIVANRISVERLHREVEQMKIPILNIGLLMSDRLREFPSDRRPLEVGKSLKAIIMRESKETIFLDRIQYLFDKELKQNAIRLFENLSGNKIILIHWPGTYEKGVLRYATPEHDEYYQSGNDYASYVIEI